MDCLWSTRIPGPSQKSCFPADPLPACAAVWRYSSPGTDFTFELHWVQQPVQISLKDSTVLWCTRCFVKFCTTSKLAEGTLCPCIQVFDEHFSPLIYAASHAVTEDIWQLHSTENSCLFRHMLTQKVSFLRDVLFLVIVETSVN